MINLFDTNDYNHFVNRINQLQADSKPQWGKMNAAQMLKHCMEVQDACNGKPLQNVSFIIKLFKSFVKKSVLSDKPYPKNSPTAPQYLVTNTIDFNEAKAAFLSSLERFVANTGSAEHTLFGTLSKEERNKAVAKHNLHHLEQFGV